MTLPRGGSSIWRKIFQAIQGWLGGIAHRRMRARRKPRTAAEDRKYIYPLW